MAICTMNGMQVCRHPRPYGVTEREQRVENSSDSCAAAGSSEGNKSRFGGGGTRKCILAAFCVPQPWNSLPSPQTRCPSTIIHSTIR